MHPSALMAGAGRRLVLVGLAIALLWAAVWWTIA
jgi:hypothetical protein